MTEEQPNAILDAFSGIQKSLNSIQNILKKDFEAQTKLKLIQSQNEQLKRRQDQEAKSETNSYQKVTKLSSLATTPNPIDFIKKFISYTFIGFLINKFYKIYPKLLETTKHISPVTSFIGGIVGGIFNIMVTIIDKTYNTFDKLRGLSKKIGGEKFQNAFDKFSSTMNTFFNVLILSGLALGSALMDPDIRSKLVSNTSGFSGRGGRKDGGVTGMSETQIRYSKMYGENAYRSKFGATPAQKRYLSRYGERPFVRRFGFNPNAPSIGQISKSGLKLARSGKFIKGNAILGLINLIVKVASGDRIDRAIVTTTGSVLGSMIGQISGGIIGAALGSVVPFLGTAILGTAGSIAGGILGGFLGDWLSEMIYNGVMSMFSNNVDNISAHAEGGYVPTRGGESTYTPPSRTVRKYPQQFKRIINKRVIPGRDIGGKKELEKIFGNPSDPKYKNPLRLLMKNSEVMGRSVSRGGFIMDIMKMGQDMASLGQRPDKTKIDNISDNFSIFIKNLILDQSSRNISRTAKSMFAMANGGYVPASRTLDNGDEIQQQIKKIFSNLLTKSIYASSAEIFRNIKSELSLLDKQDGAGGTFNDEYGLPEGISIGNFSSEDIDLLGRMIYAEASGESDLGKAAVLSVILNRWRLIKSGQVSPGTFLIQGASKDSITLKDILYAKNQFQPVTDGSLNRTSSLQGRDALAKAISKNGNNPQKLYQNLIAQKYSPEDAEYITKSAFFATTPNSNFMRAVKLGGHVFQQASNARFKGTLSQLSPIPTSVSYGQIPNFNIQNYKNISGLTIENQMGTPIRTWEQLYKFGHHGKTERGSIDPEYGMKYDFNLILPNGSTDIPLPAPISGTVITADFLSGYGYTVIIKGSNDADGTALIGHLKTTPFVKEGSRVIAFQHTIGIQGNTGRSTGPHVHISAKKHVIERYVNFFIQLSKTQSKPNQQISKINNKFLMGVKPKSEYPQLAQLQSIPPKNSSKLIDDRTYDEDRYSSEKIFILPIEKSVPQMV